MSSKPSPLALILFGDRIFYSQDPLIKQAPHTPVTRLIQGIYQKHPEDALRILRNPIWVNYEATVLCRAMTQVAAKRLRFRSDLNLDQIADGINGGIIDGINSGINGGFIDGSHNGSTDGPKDPLPALPRNSSFPRAGTVARNEPLEKIPIAYTVESPLESGQLDPREMWTWFEDRALQTDSMEPQESSSRPLYEKHRPVKALLFDDEGRLLSWAQNKNAREKTNHAEVLALQAYYEKWQEGFHSPTLLVTSLQCCKMCAAIYWQMHQKPIENLKSYYTRRELGPLAKDTLLTVASNSRRTLKLGTEALMKPLEFEKTLEEIKNTF